MPRISRLAAAWLVCCSVAAAGGGSALQAQGTPLRHFTDAQFMRGMIAHHAQALVMAALVVTRSQRSELHDLAERIDVSQRDEIALLRRWLSKHAESLDDSLHAHAGMPGMLSESELAELAATRGPTFDRLFLDDMIRHHEGALEMVRGLLATRGGGQDGEAFAFAADVDAAQRAEIQRMRALRDALPPPP